MAAGIAAGPAPSHSRIARHASAVAAVLAAAAGIILLALVLIRVLGAHGLRAAVTSPLTWLLAVAAAGAWLALWRGGLWRSLVAVSFVTAALSLYAIEAVLEFAPRSREEDIARRLGRSYDPRSRVQVLDSLRRLGVDAWPAVMPTVVWGLDARHGELPWPDSLPPLSAVPGVVTLYCNEAGQYTIYRSDALGYQNTGAPDTAGPGGVAVLGDSYVQGACVPPDSGVVQLLRARVSDTRGFGQGGSGPLLELATLREIVAPLRPRIVVWCYTEGNDLSGLHVERGQRRLASYLDPSYRLGLAGRGDRVLRRWTDSLFQLARQGPPGLAPRVAGLILLPRVRRFWHDLRDPPRPWFLPGGRAAVQPPDDADLETLGRVLATARGEVSAWGGQLLFVYLPTWERWYAPDALRARRGDALAAVHRSGVMVLDLLPVFERAPDRAALFRNRDLMAGHYSSTGYGVVAAEIARVIDSLAVAPSRR